MGDFRYDAMLSVQTEGAKRLVSFAAPAADIGVWGGIPQKKRFEGGEETSGFQREDNPKRIQDLATFLKDPRNTLQNPLLCSERTADGCKVEFIPITGQPLLGHVVISMPDLASIPLLEAFARVQAYLEARVPTLKGRKPPDELVSKLQLRARDAGLMALGVNSDENLENDDEADAQTEGLEGPEDGSTSALFEESHIMEFWEEIAARHVVLQKINPEFAEAAFLGFSREALESYLRPAVIMDGQHRLRGALLAAEQQLETPQAMKTIEARIDAGEAAAVVTADLLRQLSRKLPVSMLLDPNPAEHVFQFVVVNQKATPIGRALLGTIVSTSLSNDELGAVADRLQAAGIPLDESRAASLMARHPSSPFANLVELGLTGDNKNRLLPWPVMASLVQIFRELEGGNLYHQKNNDYARSWAKEYLEASPIIAGFRDKGFETPREYWRSFDGPWRGVFTSFWTYVRDFLGNVTEEAAHNYWGNPRASNLFNKPTLHILAADFFRYLLTGGILLESSDEVAEEARKWLGKVDRDYFNRDWKLDRAGVRKDSPGIRYAWAKTWDEYRSNPLRLPRVENYSRPSMV